MKKNKIAYVVNVESKILKNDMSYNDMDFIYEKLARKFNGVNTGAGYGFGNYRDYSFDFKTDASRKKFVSYLRQHYNKRIKKKSISLCQWTVDGEIDTNGNLIL